MSDHISRASHDQSRASDPDVSVFVSANAGSGKTHVLVNRVIRLMLEGTLPEKILCLTYTKAAAAEMSNRLYKRLAEWIPLDDDALIEKIHSNTGHVQVKKDQLAAPRQLFAKALETPGGLKIQTIHAFCEQLLHRFPIEAGVTADFKVMDDRQAGELITKIKTRFFANLDNSDSQTNSAHLAEVVKYASGQAGFDSLLMGLLNKRDDLRDLYADLDGAKLRLASALNIPVDLTLVDIREAAGSELDRSSLEYAKAILLTKKNKTDPDQANRIRDLLAASSSDQIFHALQALVLTPKLKPKAASRLCTGKTSEEHPEVFELLQKQLDYVLALMEKANCISVLNATMSLLQIGGVITALYDNEKQQRGLNDYSDLISKVLAMFAQMPSASWVLYKLDGGLDHILVDEAQDTSPAQWDIIKFLADDFFSGQNVRPDTLRSMFAVGDRKQSIYSFQGAAPKSFIEQQTHFEKIVEQSGETFEPIEFDVSFRSANHILQTVDKVFAQDIAARGVDATVHAGVRKDATGVVEVWPLVEKPDVQKLSVWNGQAQDLSERSTRLILAQKVALKISNWLKNKEILTSENRPVRPGDILILLRSRTQLMDALVRALKLQDIPVAGVDRLALTSHIAIQDLLALAKFCLLPQDDLNLAGVLKSSLLCKDDGMLIQDEELMDIGLSRDGKTFWQALQDGVANGLPFKNALNLLKTWRQRSQLLLPFEFFTSILNGDGIAKQVFGRLGQEASEPIDAFLLMAQEYEQTNVSTLQGFINWIERGDSEIKREMEQEAGQVRIMTIHGAKGLESDIVILPDTYDVPDTSKTPDLLKAAEQTWMWKLKSEFSTNLTSKLKQQFLDENNQEHNRLLYVAMTRAAERLYVGAAQSNKKLHENSWYQLVYNAVCDDDNKTEDDVFGHVWRLDETVLNKPNQTDSDEPDHASNISLPGWITTLPHSSQSPTQWLAPSRIAKQGDQTDEMHLSPQVSRHKNQFLRGNLIHKMLEYLPQVQTERRAKAQGFLDKHGSELIDKERGETLNEVMALIDNPVFAEVFSSDSLAEVPVVAKIELPDGKSYVLNGQIDRLRVSDNEILIVDYKTNRPPPRTIDQINPQYVQQLATYRLALLEMYPHHEIKAALLWTHNATLMEVPQSQLIDAFAR